MELFEGSLSSDGDATRSQSRTARRKDVVVFAVLLQAIPARFPELS